MISRSQLIFDLSTLRRVGLVLSLCTLSVVALGDDGPTQAKVAQSSTDALDEVVVTGTLIRGAGPVGSYEVTLDPSTIQAQGVVTADDLLATVPQVSNLFNNVPGSILNIAPNQIQVVTPNLRNLTPQTGSSSSTLVLVDGHRIAGVGVTQSSVDPDVIPTGAIESVEVVLDGGSATYGTDAVGGVINFITRKRFDGIQVDAHYGDASGYHSEDGNLTAGKDWGSGSLLGSIMMQENDALFGFDRSFIRQVDWTTPALTPTGRECNPGNVVLPGAFSFATFTFGPSTNYGLPNLTTPGFNACDLTKDESFVPQAKRYDGMLSLHQEFSDAVTLDVKGFYGVRTTSSYGPLRGVATVTPTNAFYEPAAANPTATQTVDFTFAPVLGSESAPSGSAYHDWGTNAEIAVKLTEHWQIRTLLNYSESDSKYHIVGPNENLLTAAGSAANPQAAVNFYNPAATPNLAVIQAIADSEIAGEGKDLLLNARSVIDGPLFKLPGGEVRLAGGYEFISDEFNQRVAPPNAVIGAVNSVAFSTYQRHVNAVFGETQIPIVGEGNRLPGIDSMIVAASMRHDQYSDFGGTNNYKIGITYKPVQWLTFLGNFASSFQAPSPVDQLGSQLNNISFFPFNAFVRPGDVPVATGTLGLQGAQADLNPQTAKTYSFGTEINPITGLRANVDYYHVRFENLLTIPTPNSGIFTNFPNNVVTNVNGLSAAQLLAFSKLAPNGPSVIAPLIAAGVPIYETVNFLEGNYGTLIDDGIDFGVNYRHATDFGAWDSSVSGTYTLDRTSQLGPGAAVINSLASDSSKFQMQATLGADIKDFRMQATLNHSTGFNVVPSATLPQHSVSNFDVVNLFFKYKMPGDDLMLKNLSFTLNVNNVFDKEPPVYKSSTGNGYENFFTLGRMWMVGVSKKF
jgi:iron complex outermembrane receptor protein